MTIRDLVAFLAGGSVALIVVGAVIGSLDVLAPGLFVTGLGLIAWWSWDRHQT